MFVFCPRHIRNSTYVRTAYVVSHASESISCVRNMPSIYLCVLLTYAFDMLLCESRRPKMIRQEVRQIGNLFGRADKP